MSIGYTGLVFDVKIVITCFNRVRLYHLETFETHDRLTSSWHYIKTFKFKSKYQMKRFIVGFEKKRGIR